MNFLNPIVRRVAALFGRREFDREMEAEMRSHIEMQTQENIEAGMKPEEARRAALRRFGWLESIKETCRDQRGVTWLQNFFRDARFAFRQLQKNPGFAAVAVLTLAICMGANLTIHSVVNAILLRPLPFPDSERLVLIYSSYPKAGIAKGGTSVANYYERRGQLDAFSHLGLMKEGAAIVGDAGSSEQELIMRVSPAFFAALGVNPTLGREFNEEEMHFQSDGVAILTDAYWREQLHSDAGVVGRTIRVNGTAHTIVGVLPRHYRFLSSKARIILPLSSAPRNRTAAERHWNIDGTMIGKLRPGVTLAEAQAQINAHDLTHAAESPDAKFAVDAGFRTHVASLHGEHVASIREVLWLLQGGVLFLLVIGAVNLVNLLLVRASGRSRELSIRQSLGANRGHIVWQVATETILLTTLGGIGGMALGAVGVRLLSRLGVEQLPLGAEVSFDARMACAALIGSTLLGIVISLPIAWFNLRGRPAQPLQSESRGGTASRAAQRLRQGLIVTQVALAMVLLTGAGLLGLSLRRVLAVSPGFRVENVLAGRIGLPHSTYRDTQARLMFTDRLLEEVGRMPGVTAVGVINYALFSGEVENLLGLLVKGHAPRPGDSLRVHHTYGVTGDYFTAAGIPLIEGRFLASSDSKQPSRACVVDQDFARHYWPDSSALGQRLFPGVKQGSDDELYTIVGVVGTVKAKELTDTRALGAVYFPYRDRDQSKIFVVVRTQQPPESFGASLRAAVRGIDPELPVYDLRPMEQRVAATLVARKSPALLAAVFAVVATCLAALGIYGVLSFAVEQRRREIGVRMALGALPKGVALHFVAQGLRLLMAGVALGLLGSWLCARSMQSILFNVPTMPWPVPGLALCVIAAVTLFACWLPARRAARVDPMVALRIE